MDKENSDKYLTVEETAKLLTIKVSTLYNLIKGKEIPYFNIGKKNYRFKKSDVMAYIEKCKVGDKNE